MIKAVLFDLDGTLVNVRKKYRFSSVKNTMKKLKAKTPKTKEIELFWFKHNRNQIIKKWNVKPKDFWYYFNKEDNIIEREKNSFVYPEVKSFIRKLRKKKIKIGVVTNAIPRVAEIDLKLIGEELIDAIIVAHSWVNRKGKPEPDSVIECMELLEVKKEKTVFVGNAEEDILAAENAGIKAVLIERGDHEIDEKIKRKADYIIKDLNELSELIELE